MNKRVEFFHGSDLIGTLDWSGPELRFEGDCEKSAKAFMATVIHVFEEEVKEIANKAYLEGYADAMREKVN